MFHASLKPNARDLQSTPLFCSMVRVVPVVQRACLTGAGNLKAVECGDNDEQPLDLVTSELQLDVSEWELGYNRTIRSTWTFRI